MEQFKRFTQPKDPQEPQKPLPFSEGRYGFGSQFTLTHKVKGTQYRIGDRFTYISQTESVAHNPYILKIGDGLGEYCFLDPNGRAVVLSADMSVVNTLFEYVQPEPDVVVLSEGEEWTPPPPPPVYITEEQFKEFRKGLATVLSEIAAIVPQQGQRGERGEQGERGERGERGESGWTGWPGDKGEPGKDGEKGEKGDAGEKGDTGEPGIQGERGDKGDTGAKGERGERGEKGDTGERGQVGPRGEKGEKGDKGDRGEYGIQGPAGKDGKDGKDGKEGRVGEKGLKGDKGEQGERGEPGKKGDKGEQGDSGLLSAKFPLVYDPKEKSVGIDEARLDKILKKILGGGKVSAQDMGWLASTGGGGKVAVYFNGTKVTPDVRGVNFTGSAVESVTKVGGKVTVKLIGGVSSVNGLTGDVNLVIAGAGGKVYYLNPSTSGSVAGYRQLGTDSYGGGGTSATVTLTNANQWVLVDKFITDVGQPDQSFLPGGNWDIDFFATSNAGVNETKFYMDVWLYQNGGTTLSLGSSVSTPTFISEPATLKSYSSSVYVSPRTLVGTDQIAVLLYAATTKNQTHTVTGYYEDNTVSHIHTTFPAAVFPSYVSSFNGRTGAVQGVSSWNGQTGAVTFTNYVSSFNGLTGAVQGVSSAAAGTGISVSGSTGAVTITNTGALTVNGKTGNIKVNDATPVYRYTTKKIPGLGEFTLDSSTWTENPDATGADSLKHRHRWFRINALKDFQNNADGLTFESADQPLVITYEDYFNSIVGIVNNYDDPEYGVYTPTNVFLANIYIKEVYEDKEPIQLCIHPNGVMGNDLIGATGTTKTTYPQSTTDWYSWTNGNSAGYPPLFDSDFDGDIDTADAANLAVYGYFAFGFGFTPGGGERASGATGAINPRFVEGKEYYIHVVTHATDINSENANRLAYYTRRYVLGNSVLSFNGRTGAVQGVSAAVAGTGISVSGATGAVTITNTGVQSFNGLTGAVTGVTTGTANTFGPLQSFTDGISAAGGTFSSQARFLSGITVAGDATFSGSVTAPTPAVGNNSTLVATTAFVQNEIVADAVTAFNGLTGAVTGASLGANTFTALNSFNAGISSNGGTFSSLVRFNAGLSAAGVTTSTITNVTDIYARDFGAIAGLTLTASPDSGIQSSIYLRQTTSANDTGLLDIKAGTVQISTAGGAIGDNPSLKLKMYDGDVDYNWVYIGSVDTIITADRTYDFPDVSGVFVLDSNISSVAVTSFNGNVGAVQGVSSAAAGTGIRISAATGAITITNIGVQTFNGLTGAVTGASLGANTFTALNSFNAGISSNGGTFSANTRFLSGIQTDSVLPTTGAGGIVYINSNSSGNGGSSVTYIGDWDSSFNGTSIMVDDQGAEISLNSSTVSLSGDLSTGVSVTSPIYSDTYSKIQTYRTTTTATTANQTIATISEVYDNTQLPAAMYYPALEATISAWDSVANKTEMLKMLIVQNGADTVNTQYGLIRTGATGPVSSYSTTLSGSPQNLLIQATPSSANSTQFTVTVRAHNG